MNNSPDQLQAELKSRLNELKKFIYVCETTPQLVAFNEPPLGYEISRKGPFIDRSLIFFDWKKIDLCEISKVLNQIVSNHEAAK